MPQLAVAAAGAWLGGAIGIGASAGWAIGSILGSLLFAPSGPKAQMADTRAPKIDFGARMHRVYGTVRVPLSPRWVDDFTADGQSAGGKGGGSETSYYTYSTNVLYWAADGINVLGVSRIWKDGELVWSGRADSDAESVANSLDNENWADMQFFDGGASQLPWSVYEAAVGSVNADAHRGIACIGFAALQTGNSPRLPFMEAEIYTAGTGTPAVGGYIGSVEGQGFSPTAVDGIQAGDALFLLVHHDGTLTPPSGWNYVADDLDSAAALSLSVLTRTADGTATDSTMGFTTDGVGASWVTFVLRGVSDTEFPTPMNAPINFAAEAGTSPGNVTRPLSPCIAIAAAYISESGGRTLVAPPEGYEQIVHQTYDAGSVNGHFLAGYKIVSGTSENPGQFEVGSGGYGIGGLGVMTLMVSYEPFTGITLDCEDLADVVEAECLRCGLTSSQIDVTDLVGTPVCGFKCEGTGRDAIEQLMAAFFFYAIAGEKIAFRLLDTASIATIEAEDTGVGIDSTTDVFAGLMRGNDLELPAQVSITAPTMSMDHDPLTATSDRIVTVGNAKTQASLAVLLTPSQIKGIANAMVLDGRVAAHTGSFSVSDKHATYEPGDVIVHSDDEGNTYTLRWLRETYTLGQKTIEARLFDRSVLTPTGTMSDTYTPALTVAVAETPTLYLLDIPILRDVDDGYGIYATVTADGKWEGAELFLSRDDVTYESVGLFANRGIAGSATELADFTGWTWDSGNTVTVTTDDGTDSLTSSTKSAIEADATLNVAAIGEHGRWEIVRFATASLLAPNSYLLSNFLRGQFGTEHANADHEAGDTFVLMRTTGIVRVILTAGDVGNVLYFKAVPPGRALSAVDAVTLTYTAEGLKPYAPVDLQAATEDGATVVTWNRRSRLASPFLLTTQPPLGETTESYDVELLDGSDAVIQSDTVTEAEWTVSAYELTQTVNLLETAYALRSVGGEIVGIYDWSPSSLLQQRKFVRHDSAGAFVAFSDDLGHEVTQWVNNGDDLYAVVHDFAAGHPYPYSESRVVLYDRTAIGSAVATNTAASPGDYQGIAWDGSKLWVSERDSGNIRELNPTTLASVADYAVVDPGPLAFAGGDLVTVCLNDSELVRWDIATQTEVYRVPCVTTPYDVIVSGALVFVLSFNGLGVYLLSDGSEVAVYPTYAGRMTRPQRNMAEHGGSVLVGGFLYLVSFDSSGDLEYTIQLPADDFWGLSDVSGDLWLQIEPEGPGSTSLQTRSYTIDAADLSGSVRVYQNSAAIGRGHPASLEL
jgi:hypothetical protein